MFGKGWISNVEIEDSVGGRNENLPSFGDRGFCIGGRRIAAGNLAVLERGHGT